METRTKQTINSRRLDDKELNTCKSGFHILGT